MNFFDILLRESRAPNLWLKGDPLLRAVSNFTPAVQAPECAVGAPPTSIPSSLIDVLLARLELKPGDTFIDLGAGDGAIVAAAARRVPRVHAGMCFRNSMCCLSFERVYVVCE